MALVLPGTARMRYEVDIAANGHCVDLDTGAMRQAVLQALSVESISEAVISVSLVDNATIQKINREYLGHDYPTDVLSFQLDWTHPERISAGCGDEQRSAGARVEGEIVVSIEYAQSEAVRLGWELQSELTLYVIHGMLHLCGYDDLNPAESQIMRAREAGVLGQLGLLTIPRHVDTEVQSSDCRQEAPE